MATNDRVFLQASALATPKLARLFGELEKAWGDVAATTVGHWGGWVVHAFVGVCETSLVRMTDTVIEACISAHRTVKNRRNNDWSEATFSTWCDGTLVALEARMAQLWPNGPDMWAPLRPEFHKRIGLIAQRERDRAKAEVVQHFRTESKSWYQAALAIAKEVPTDLWKWVFGGGAFALVFAALKLFGVV